MIKSPINQLQKAIVEALEADSDVASYVGDRIYDDVPDDEEIEFPYISIDLVTNISVMADCIDLAQVRIQIDVWSRESGFEELREITEAVRAALHDKSLNLISHACVNISHEQTQEIYDPDGQTKHGAIIFEATIERL